MHYQLLCYIVSTYIYFLTSLLLRTCVAKALSRLIKGPLPFSTTMYIENRIKTGPESPQETGQEHTKEDPGGSGKRGENYQVLVIFHEINKITMKYNQL